MTRPGPVPGWLLAPEGYRPAPGRDRFLDRTLAALLGLAARLRAGGGAGGRAGTDPVVKAAAAAVVVLTVALTSSPRVLALAGAGLLGVLALQDPRVIAGVLKACLAAGIVSALALAPAALLGAAPAAGRMLAKVLASTAAVQLVAATTAWPALAAALRRLGGPEALLLVLDLTLKYLVLLGAYALALVQALQLRSVGRHRRGTPVLADLAGTLFLKSLDQAEALHDAMRCRAFTGEYRPSGRVRLGLRELALGGAAGALAALSFLAGA